MPIAKLRRVRNFIYPIFNSFFSALNIPYFSSIPRMMLSPPSLWTSQLFQGTLFFYSRLPFNAKKALESVCDSFNWRLEHVLENDWLKLLYKYTVHLLNARIRLNALWSVRIHRTYHAEENRFVYLYEAETYALRFDMCGDLRRSGSRWGKCSGRCHRCSGSVSISAAVAAVHLVVGEKVDSVRSKASKEAVARDSAANRAAMKSVIC